MSALLINANALNIPLADKSVQCVVTSPPYYGLRENARERIYQEEMQPVLCTREEVM